ncbi:MAG: PAS domain S-box protein [Desulfomonile tiedjei]|nr:PAS domain S-box protein [Desulfomonile tiedjei]
MENQETSETAVVSKTAGPNPLLKELESKVSELATLLQTLRESQVEEHGTSGDAGVPADAGSPRKNGRNGDGDRTGEASDLGRSVDVGAAADPLSVAELLEENVRLRKEIAELRENAGTEKPSPQESPVPVETAEEAAEAPREHGGIERPDSLLRTTVESVPDGIVVLDAKGRMVLFNQRLFQIWQVPEKALEAKGNAESLMFLAARLKLPQQLLAKVKQVVSRPEGDTTEILELRDGRMIETTTRLHTLGDDGVGTTWTFREVTDRCRAEQALLDSEARFRMLVQDLRLGIASCDVKGIMNAANPEILAMLGHADEAAAKPANLLSHPALVDAGISAAIRRCLDSGEPFFGEFPCKRPSGTLMQGRMHLAPVRGDDGRIKGAHIAIEDISGQKRAEDLIVRSQRLKVLGQMASGISHTFSNLLQIVSGNANMALTNLELEEYEEIRLNLEQILDSTRSATDAVRRLQQFSRERSKREVPRKELFDLSDAVREGVEMCRLWSKAKLERERIEVVQELDLTPGCYVEGEPDQLAWVVLNLVKNAIEALPEGGKVRVKTSIKDDQAVLLVQDNGVGIRDEDIKNITAAFWSSKEAHPGMGLAVNCGIIRQHGATMGVKRMKPRGTAFTVKLPLVKKPSAKKEEVRKQAPDRAYRILLIDDERPVVTILGKGLRKRGNTAYIALSGQEGLDILENNDVDVVVCDLGMEGMNGWDVSSAVMGLCVEKEIPKPPFILLTGWGGQLADDELLYHPHVDKIVEKPVTLSALLEIIGDEVKKVETAGP